MAVVVRLVAEGAGSSIYAYGDDDSCELFVFFAKCKRDDKKEWARLRALIDYTAEKGPPRNEQKLDTWLGPMEYLS